MPPQAVLDALGGSVAAAELKGDFAAAEAAAGAALDAARAGADPQARADAAIWASIVATLRCELSAAASRLTEALAAVPDHPLGPAVRDFAAATGRRMPDGNLSPPLLGTNPVNLPWPPKGELLEEELFAQTWLPRRGSNVQRQLDSPGSALREALEFGLRDLARIWDERPYARLAAAELCRRAGVQELADRHLDAATAAYSDVGDAAGLAGCELARGAWAAVSAGSPQTLGLELWEESVSGSANPVNVGDRVFAATPPATAGAPFYQRAEAGFRAVGADRGVAMVDLHRAAVAALHDDPAAALEAAERAREAFVGAGDAAGAHLADAHGALARIQAREWPERTDVAEAIGTWGSGSGSPGWALGIGFVFGHAGWRWLRREGDADRALACIRLAQTTFSALGAADLAQQTLGDRAAALAWAGDLEAALAAADRSLHMFVDLQARHPAESDLLAQREETAAAVVRWLAYEARDAERVETVRPTLERQRARHEAAASWEGAPPLVAKLAAKMRRALVWDAAFAPAFRALAARRRNPLEFGRQLERALEAAGAVADDERGRLEASVLLECADRAAGRAAFAAHPPPEPDPPDLGLLISDARLAASLEDWTEARRRHEGLAGVRRDWWALAPEPWSELGELARTAEGLGELARARELYGSALARLEARRSHVTRRRERDLPSASALYGDAARAELAAAETGPGVPAAALGLAERGRASGLLSDMARSAALAGATPNHATELQRWRALTARIAMLTSMAARGEGDHAAALSAAEAELDSLESKLKAEDPRWLEAVNPPIAAFGAQEIRASLPEGTLLIEHLLVRGALLAWAITRDGPVQWSLRRTDELALDELQRKFWTACQGRSPLWERFAGQLGEALLAPFDDAIAACRQVVMVPHRWGLVAPLSALHWGGAPLIDAEPIRPVSVLPSASALRFVRESVPGPRARLLAVGDPTNMSRRRPGEAKPSGGFGALPWCGAQAAEAASLFGSGPPLLGAEAREQAVRRRLEGAQIVHFATHGVIDPAPLLSCIVLAEGDTLDVWELLGLPLDADLVTYSACDSAGAPDERGEEITGLAWLTLAAGARAVVAALWKVSELSTALLMRAFYKALHEGEPPREALAAAQRHVRGLTRETAAPEIAALRAAARHAPDEPDDVPDDFSHPYHWAGFVLIGV